MTDTIEKVASTNPPTKQATRYLGNCTPIVRAWHQRLLEIKNKAQQLQGEDGEENSAYLKFFRTTISASDAAKLKHCQHMDDVAIQPAFIALWHQVEPTLIKSTTNHSAYSYKVSDNAFAAWLAVAWVLSQVRTVDDSYLVASAGKSKRQLNNTLACVAGQRQDDGDRPLITPLRFEKLISARDPDNFVSLLARMVAQLQQQGQAINLVWLANDILHWFADYQGSNYRTPKDKLTVQWSLTYYQMHSD